MEECNHVLLWGIKDALAYAHRARVYYWQENYDQALADCTQALHIDIGSAEALGVRGLLLYRQKKYKEALSFFEKARELGHDLFWLDEAELATRSALQLVRPRDAYGS